jgi:hypothetical protein
MCACGCVAGGRRSASKALDTKRTNAFTKKQDKLPATEKERALKAMQDYEQRVKTGTYYERR